MADNYRMFSEALLSLNAVESAWAESVLRIESGDVDALDAAGIETAEIDVESWPGFSWELSRPSGELWLYTQEFGEVANVAEFVRAFLARFRPGEAWKMTWAETCSKPRIGEFSGGGAFVTAAAARFHTPYEWLHQLQAEFRAAASIKPPPHS